MRISQASSLDIMKASMLSARGDLVMRGAAVPERLGAGIMDNMLVSNGPAADLTWEYNNIFFDVTNIRYRTRIVDIGVWNMDVTTNKNVVHGLTFTNILFAGAIIYDNTYTNHSLINRGVLHSDTTPQGFVDRINNANIKLSRLTGGFFDSVDYNNALMNRGKVFIIYLF